MCTCMWLILIRELGPVQHVDRTLATAQYKAFDRWSHGSTISNMQSRGSGPPFFEKILFISNTNCYE